MSFNLPEERRRDYPDLMAKMMLMENDLSYIKQYALNERENIKEWVDSLKKHNAKLMHLQGYEDRVNEKLDNLSSMAAEVRELKIDAAVIKREIEFMKETLVDHAAEARKFIDKCDNKFASKKTFDGHVFQDRVLNSIFVTAIIGIFIGLFVK